MDSNDEPDDVYGGMADLLERPPAPINWNLLDANDADIEWHDLDSWVTWLKVTFGLPPSIVPPYWHRHDELVWELSASPHPLAELPPRERERLGTDRLAPRLRRRTSSAAGLGGDLRHPTRP